MLKAPQKQLAFNPVLRLTMIFPFATTFITVFALGQTALAALTPAQVIVNINTVTDISTSANSALVPLSPTTTPTQIRATATVSYLGGLKSCDLLP